MENCQEDQRGGNRQENTHKGVFNIVIMFFVLLHFLGVSHSNLALAVLSIVSSLIFYAITRDKDYFFTAFIGMVGLVAYILQFTQ
jgi:hypothetical protein